MKRQAARNASGKKLSDGLTNLIFLINLIIITLQYVINNNTIYYF